MASPSSSSDPRRLHWVRVAVTQRVVEDTRIRERRDALSHDWTARLARWGALPLLVPNTWPQPEHLLEVWDAAAVLLTGGNTPALTELPPNLTRDSSPERDGVERKLIDEALRRGIPVLGVCRGAEMLNLHLGGRVAPVPRSGSHAGVFHPIAPVAMESGGPAIDFGAATVNSYHDLQIALPDLAADLRPFALAPDRTVEGFYHPRLPVLGVMWHPERAGPRCAPLDTLLSGVLRGHAPWLAAPASSSR